VQPLPNVAKVALAVVAVLATTIAAAGGADARRAATPTSIMVMTRNAYLGADIAKLFTPKTLNEVLVAAGGVWADVQANSFQTRARALAAEIATHKPDVVGLQEVPLYRTDTPFDGPITPAETVAQDFLQMLLDALKARGHEYRAAGVFEGTDAELPVGFPPQMDVRFTDRIAVIVRGDAARRGIRVRNVTVGTYGASLGVPVAGQTLPVRRGWVTTVLGIGKKTVVVVDTHLEAFNADARAAQGQQLLAGIAPTQVPIALLGDFNSGPGGNTAVYDAFRSGGFEDAWTQARGTDPGLTCCHKDDLRDPDAALRSRIDLVLVKNGLRATKAEVLGEAPGDRVGNLWPSDHAGVVATLRLP
jgi:endonuclease/exonuclease/phosphatase family metal-dependent hydrolase